MTVNAPGTRTETGKPTWRTLYFVAGIGSIVFVLLLISALVVDFIAPPPVHGGTETLEFIAANKVPYVLEQVLWILPNVLAVLVFVALFIAMSPVNKSLALIGALLGALSWAMFLAIPVTSRGSLTLVYLSDQYMAASAPERDRFAFAAEAIVAENNTPAIVAVLGLRHPALGLVHRRRDLIDPARTAYTTHVDPGRADAPDRDRGQAGWILG
jgi:hypothetical protein